MRRALAALFFVVLAPGSLAAQEIDPASGFIVDENYQLVVQNCTACHSGKLVTQMRGSREVWESLIRWMQATQNLWPLPPATESAILDYLAKHYAPAATVFRRKPLDDALLPPRIP